MDVRKKSQRQEKRVAKELGGKVTPASGALWGAKGDVRSDMFLVECKTTDKNYYSLSNKTWKKIYEEALNDSLRIAVMCIEIQGESYAVIRWNDFTSFCKEHLDSVYLPDIHVTKKSIRIQTYNTPAVFRCEDWSQNEYTTDLLVILWEDFVAYVEESFSG